MKIAPCKGCIGRNPGCHDRCEDYQEWRKERTELNELRHKQAEIRAVVMEGERRRCKSQTESSSLNNYRESKRRKRQ